MELFFIDIVIKISFTAPLFSLCDHFQRWDLRAWAESQDKKPSIDKHFQPKVLESARQC